MDDRKYSLARASMIKEGVVFAARETNRDPEDMKKPQPEERRIRRTIQDRYT